MNGEIANRVTASYKAKRPGQQWGNVEVFLSATKALPDDATIEDFSAAYDELYTMLSVKAEAQLDEMIERQLAKVPPMPVTSNGNGYQPRNDGPSAAVAIESAWSRTDDYARDWGLLRWPPKKAELRVGDVYTVLADRYNVIRKDGKFSVEVLLPEFSKWKMATMYSASRSFKDLWNPVNSLDVEAETFMAEGLCEFVVRVNDAGFANVVDKLMPRAGAKSMVVAPENVTPRTPVSAELSEV